MNESNVRQLHVLVLGDPQCGEDLARGFGTHARVHQVDTVEAALRALRTEKFDVVISRAADFMPSAGMPLTGEAAAVLDGVNEGVAIVGRSGELEWASPKMLSLPEEIRERVCTFCVDAFNWAQAEADAGAPTVRGRRLTFTTRNNEHYSVTATPVIDLHRRITQVAAVVWDATNAKRLQDKIDAIDRAGRELLNLDAEQIARLDAEERLSLLEQKVLRCTSEILQFENSEIRILNRKTNLLELVLASGIPAATDFDLYATSEGNGISGYVAARGRSYICPDARKDPRFRVAIDETRSSLTVPLMLQDEVVGVANFESAKLAAFNEDDRQFAEIFARYIALALHVLELLDTERHTTTGRLGTNVMAEITAPLNDILTDVEGLVEDYIGHDDLRHRLREISENVVTIRETIKELTSSKPGLIGTHAALTVREDPVLNGKRILIADDEDVIRDTVHDVLRGHGCEVSTAADGAAAVDLIAKKPFDLVLSDIKMPQKNGYEVFAAAKDADPDTPVILTTGFGYDPNHSIVRARREGLAAVLFKPFKVDQLLGEIRTALTTVKT